MRILLTNDDGIHAPGLIILAERLLRDGHELAITAPLRETSGSGTSVGSQLDGQFVPAELVTLPELDGVRAVAVDGPPCLAVLAVCHGLMDVTPDLLISGINPGNNIGRLSIHSGTLGAARTAAGYGLRAVAVSCPSAPGERYAEAADFMALAVETLATREADGLVFNINYPPAPFSEVRGVRAAAPAAPPDGDVTLDRETGGFRMRVSRDANAVAAESDLVLLGAGYISIACADRDDLRTTVTDELCVRLDSLMHAAQVATAPS